LISNKRKKTKEGAKGEVHKGYRTKVASCREISECKKSGALLMTDALRFRENVPGKISLF